MEENSSLNERTLNSNISRQSLQSSELLQEVILHQENYKSVHVHYPKNRYINRPWIQNDPKQYLGIMHMDKMVQVVYVQS